MIPTNETSDVPALIAKIQSLIGTMSKSERRVCEFICSNPREVIHLSVSELAKASGVGDATVIRACGKIGSRSYQELKIQLAQDVVSPLQSLNDSVTVEDSAEVILEKVFQSSINTIKLTQNLTKVEDIELAAKKLLNARRIAICGLGNSHTVAMDLQHKLLRLGLNAVAYEDNHLQMIGSSFLTSEDVACCISHSGSSKDIVKAASIAKQNHAFIISLTTLGNSPLSDLADLPLYAASNETHYRTTALTSRIALMAIVDAIYTFIALTKEDSAEGFYTVEANLSDTKF